MPISSGPLQRLLMKGKIGTGLISEKFDPSLVLDLPLTEGQGQKAPDRSIYGNTGQIIDVSYSGTLADWVAGRIGKALYFDGDTEIYAPDTVSLDPSITNKFTVLAWVNPASAQSGAIVCKGYRGLTLGSNNLQWVFYVTTSDFIKSDIELDIFTPDNAFSTNSNVAPANQWSHIGASYDGQNVYLYVNGQIVAGPISFSANLIPNVTPGNGVGGLLVGSDQFATSASLPYTGILQGIKIYNKILSQAQINAIYKSELKNGPF